MTNRAWGECIMVYGDIITVLLKDYSIVELIYCGAYYLDENFKVVYESDILEIVKDE